MEKINILYIIEYLAHGGTEKQLLQLIDGIDRERFVPHLCCLRLSMIGENRHADALRLFDSVACQKLQLDFVSLAEFGSPFQIYSLYNYVKRNKINIIQTYFQDPTIIGFLAGRLAGVKHLVACFRDMAFWIQEEKPDRALWLAYRFGRGFIANSQAVKERYISLFGLHPERVSVIYNGIDIGETPVSIPAKKTDVARPRVVGIVANLNRAVKRVDLFLEAAAQLSHWNQAVRFVVLGDGELRAGLEQRGRDIGLGEKISFLGRIPNVGDFLAKNIDVGVLTSDSEGFSNAILEYMAHGVPVVATDVGGNSEIIENGVNGFLARPGDSHDIAEKIKLLLGNHAVYENIRETAFHYVVSQYSSENCIRQYEKFYEQLMLNPK